MTPLVRLKHLIYFILFLKKTCMSKSSLKYRSSLQVREQTLSNRHLPLKLATGNPPEIALRFKQARSHLPDFSRVPKKGGTKPKVASETTSYVELGFPTISDMNQWASNPQNKTTQSRLCGFAFLCNPYTRGEVGICATAPEPGAGWPLYSPDLLTGPHP